MTSIDLTELPGQSTLFVDFINGQESIRERFTSSSTEGNISAPRQDVADVILKSMYNVELSMEQESNLEKFRKNALTIVTGQQVGFLGGPLYTLYKIQTAITIAEQLTNKGRTAVPVFWVEDNDHDAKEAAKASIPTKEFGCFDTQAASNIDALLRIPVSDWQFGNDIVNIINNIAEILPEAAHKTDTVTFLNNIYKQGTTWSDAFIQFVHTIFAESGLLIIRASTARLHGLMKPIVQFEMQNKGLLEQSVVKANDSLSTKGYHTQAKPSHINLFLHNESGRHKINNIHGDAGNYAVGPLLYATQELSRLVDSAPERFSPSVLLRPLIQDYILSSHMYIAGPGEVGYLSQLKEAYQAFHISMPVIQQRSSATLLPKRILRFLEKQQLSYSYFFQPWAEVEKKTLATLSGQEVLENINASQQTIHKIFDEVKKSVKTIDATLEPTVGSAERALEKEFETMSKKVNAAIKRRSEQIFSKFRETSTFIFPNAGLQERQLSPIFVLCEVGFDGLRQLLKNIAIQQNTKHHIVEISGEQ
ncbi:MAG: bacillithiol biosynthesis cysteine-adding enzyme BshC [Candidatus Kapaibacterium sp.]